MKNLADNGELLRLSENCYVITEKFTGSSFSDGVTGHGFQTHGAVIPMNSQPHVIPMNSQPSVVPMNPRVIPKELTNDGQGGDAYQV